MIVFHSIKDIQDLCVKNKGLADIAIDYEIEITGKGRSQIVRAMKERVKYMIESIEMGRKRLRSLSGWVGDEAWILEHSQDSEKLCGSVITTAMVNALAISGLNACRGRIVAAPTAGSCGVLPGAVLAVANELKVPNYAVVKSMFVAGAIGVVIDRNSTFSAAEGGCQAECGTASAMAAAGIVYLKRGGTDRIFNAAALALKNSLGLSCDPIGGLVEIPCVKRNAFYAVHAVAAAQLALSGIKSLVSLDTVIEAMARTAEDMPKSLRETSTGGLAATVEGIKLTDRLKRSWEKAGQKKWGINS